MSISLSHSVCYEYFPWLPHPPTQSVSHSHSLGQCGNFQGHRAGKHHYLHHHHTPVPRHTQPARRHTCPPAHTSLSTVSLLLYTPLDHVCLDLSVCLPFSPVCLLVCLFASVCLYLSPSLSCSHLTAFIVHLHQFVSSNLCTPVNHLFDCICLCVCTCLSRLSCVHLLCLQLFVYTCLFVCLCLNSSFLSCPANNLSVYTCVTCLSNAYLSIPPAARLGHLPFSSLSASSLIMSTWVCLLLSYPHLPVSCVLTSPSCQQQSIRT